MTDEVLVDVDGGDLIQAALASSTRPSRIKEECPAILDVFDCLSESTEDKSLSSLFTPGERVSATLSIPESTLREVAYWYKPIASGHTTRATNVPAMGRGFYITLLLAFEEKVEPVVIREVEISKLKGVDSIAEVRAERLIDYFGTAESVLNASKKEIQAAGVSSKKSIESIQGATSLDLE